LVTAAKIAHKEARNTNRVERKAFLGLKAERPRYEGLWLTYYGYRNVVWLTRKAGSPLNNLRLITRHVWRLAEVVAYDDRKWRRIRFWTQHCLTDGRTLRK